MLEESSDEDVIWCKGDVCLVRQSSEDDLAKARIKEFTQSGRKQKAVVTYHGYSSEYDEEIELKRLRKPRRKKKDRREGQKEAPPQNAMFSPLSGHEEKKRLQDKFAWLDKEEKEEERKDDKSGWGTTSRKLLDPLTPNSSEKSQKKRRGIVAEGGGNSKTRSSSQSSSSSTTKIKPSSMKSKLLLDIEDDDSDREEQEQAERAIKNKGFSERDLEKPYFTHALHLEEDTIGPMALSDEHKVPRTINRYLREYQRDGIRFLYGQYMHGRGGILADDMGLGKTVQVISFIAAILGKTGTKADVLKQRPNFIRKMSNPEISSGLSEPLRRPFLIIGPASVLYNWLSELDTWGYFTVGRYHKQWKSSTVADLKKNKLEVVLTTFETCRDNIEEINKFEWEAVIADEAHKIKGLKAEVTLALKSLRCQKRFGLTGTPLQNKLEELWCILDWAVPGFLGNLRQYQDNFVKKIEKGQKADATKRQLAEARKAQEKLSKLRDEHMLRRTKDIIAHQMPKKHELVVYCKPTNIQLRMYRAVLQQDDMQYIMRQYQPCHCDSGAARGKCCYKKTPSGISVKSLTFSYLNLLLKVANHVALLLPETIVAEKQAKYALKVCEQVFEEHPEFARLSREASFRTLSDPEYCGKMKVLTGMLAVFRKQKSRVLLFSYSVRLLDIVEQYLIARGYEYRRLDGSVPEQKRFTLVNEFNKDPGIFIFLASTKAGGVGLNLTGANVVVIFDPNWNPTHDLQAQDRAYRLGQVRDVKVYRLICSGTIEENIYLRQLYKQQLDTVAVGKSNARRYFHGIQGNKQEKGELFGLENMFKLRSGDRCMTEDIIKKNKKVEDALSSNFNVEEYVPPVEKKSCKEKEVEEEEKEEDIIQSLMSDNEEDEQEEATSEPKPKSKFRPEIDASVSKDIADIDALFGLDKLEEKQFKVPAIPQNHTKAIQAKSPASTTCVRKLENNGKLRRKLELDIEDFSSDDEDTMVKGRGKHTPGLQRKGKNVRHAANGDVDKERKEEAEGRAISTVAFESVSDVFADCGVVHTHRNKEVVGASRAEDHMTRCAIKDVYELQQDTQEPAAHCAAMETQSSEESDDYGSFIKKPKKKKSASPKKSTPSKSAPPAKSAASRTEVIGHTKLLIGQTPKGIRLSQFQEMSDSFGYASLHEFAEAVLRSGPNKLPPILHEFYEKKEPELADKMSNLIPLETPKEDEVKPKTPNKAKRGREKPSCADVRPPKLRKKPTPKRKGPVFSDMSESDDGDGEVEGERSRDDKREEQRKKTPRKVSRKIKRAHPTLSSSSDTEIEGDDYASFDNIACDRKLKRNRRRSLGDGDLDIKPKKISDDNKSKQNPNLDLNVREVNLNAESRIKVAKSARPKSRTSAESIEAMVNDMFDDDVPPSKATKSPLKKSPIKKTRFNEDVEDSYAQLASKRTPSKGFGKNKTLENTVNNQSPIKAGSSKTKGRTKAERETFAFLDSVFFD